MDRLDTHPMQLDALRPAVRRVERRDLNDDAAPWSDTLPSSVSNRSPRQARERRDRLWGSGVAIGLIALLVVFVRGLLRR